jgi:hypothetical protein
MLDLVWDTLSRADIALTYDHEPVDLCAKDLIQFLVAKAVQQFLEPIEQLFFVDHLL